MQSLFPPVLGEQNDGSRQGVTSFLVGPLLSPTWSQLVGTASLGLGVGRTIVNGWDGRQVDLVY